jgi:hypothetical protein
MPSLLEPTAGTNFSIQMGSGSEENATGLFSNWLDQREADKNNMILQPKDLNELYKSDREVYGFSFDRPMSREHADMTVRRHQALAQASFASDKARGGAAWAGTLGSLVGSFADPVAIAAGALVPQSLLAKAVPSLGKVAANAAKFKYFMPKAASPLNPWGKVVAPIAVQNPFAQRVKAKVILGAAEGVAGNAIIEPGIRWSHAQDYVDYSMVESMANVAFGGVLGGVFNTAGFVAKAGFKRALFGIDSLREKISPHVGPGPTITPVDMPQYSAETGGVAGVNQTDFAASMLRQEQAVPKASANIKEALDSLLPVLADKKVPVDYLGTLFNKIDPNTASAQDVSQVMIEAADWIEGEVISKTYEPAQRQTMLEMAEGLLDAADDIVEAEKPGGIQGLLGMAPIPEAQSGMNMKAHYAAFSDAIESLSHDRPVNSLPIVYQDFGGPIFNPTAMNADRAARLDELSTLQRFNKHFGGILADEKVDFLSNVYLDDKTQSFIDDLDTYDLYTEAVDPWIRSSMDMQRELYTKTITNANYRKTLTILSKWIDEGEARPEAWTTFRSIRKTERAFYDQAADGDLHLLSTFMSTAEGGVDSQFSHSSGHTDISDRGLLRIEVPAGMKAGRKIDYDYPALTEDARGFDWEDETIMQRNLLVEIRRIEDYHFKEKDKVLPQWELRVLGRFDNPMVSITPEIKEVMQRINRNDFTALKRTLGQTYETYMDMMIPHMLATDQFDLSTSNLIGDHTITEIKEYGMSATLAEAVDKEMTGLADAFKKQYDTFLATVKQDKETAKGKMSELIDKESNQLQGAEQHPDFETYEGIVLLIEDEVLEYKETVNFDHLVQKAIYNIMDEPDTVMQALAEDAQKITDKVAVTLDEGDYESLDDFVKDTFGLKADQFMTDQAYKQLALALLNYQLVTDAQYSQLILGYNKAFGCF